jgi:hypothetical protein
MIEVLESRIAPAAVYFFTDIDGDHVKISSTLGTNTLLAAAVTLSNNLQPAVGKPHNLEMLTLGSAFNGASISITATPSDDLTPGTINGSGFVNVGYISAAGIDLKSVTVHGDLGQIVVGNANVTNKPGLGSLTVQSMGNYGTTTGAISADSRFINGVGSIKVAGDVNGVLLRADTTTTDYTVAKIGSIFIGGNLIGGTSADTGEIAANNIGSVKIMGSVIGSFSTDTGRIATTVEGQTVPTGGTLGSIFIGGDLVGGSAQATGAIYSPATLGAVTIRGSVVGGSAITSGGIDGNTIGAVTIGGDLTGIGFSSASDVDHSAFVRSQTNIKSVTIAGSIVSGSESGGGTLSFSGAIQAGQTLGPVKVGGSIQGTANDAIIISGVGLAAPTKHTQDPAIKSVTVGGSVTFAMVEGGYDLVGNAASGDAQIGAVKIGGDLIESDIIAGIKVKSGNTNGFGTATDTLIDQPGPAGTDGIVATISSIVVGGQIEGSTTNSNATFGIEAQTIGSVKTGVDTLHLEKTNAIDFITVSGATGNDVYIRQLPGT